MNVNDFLKVMKDEVLDTDMSISLDTLLVDIEEWDSLSVVSFLALVKKLSNRKERKNTDVNIKMVQNAKTIQDLYNLLQA